MKIVDSRLAEGNPGRDRGIWVTLGGRVKNDEDVRDAARREILEETGLTVDVGPPRWYGEQVLTLAGRDRLLKETFVVARPVGASAGAAGLTLNSAGLSQQERSVIREFRWWSLTELAETSEVIKPPRLAEMIDEAVSGTGFDASSPQLISLQE